MSRYHALLSDEEVREALRLYVQSAYYPHQTIGDVVYFTHDIITGSTAVEFSYPLPEPISGDDVEGVAV